ncbi:MAG: sugar kinase [Alphaproteobacteria bacterium]
MQALFIGQTYIDVTFIAGTLPTGDQKLVAEDYAVSFGGNAVTAAFACAKLGIKPELMTSLANDWLGNMFRDMAGQSGIVLHAREVAQSSLSFVMPKDGKRAIIRCRDANYLNPIPDIDLTGCRAIHLDGHQPEAAVDYARRARQAGILTSLDGGSKRARTDELLTLIDVAVVSELLCEQYQLTPGDMLKFLHSKGAKIAGVTLGANGAVWSQDGGPANTLPAYPLPPSQVIDTNGAGDIFHGAYMYSYLNDPAKSWAAHFDFARAASTHSIQHLGNEASLPQLKDIAAMQAIINDNLPEIIQAN